MQNTQQKHSSSDRSNKQAFQEAAQVVVVDDHPTVRQAVAERLEKQAGLAVGGEAASAAEAQQLIEEKGPQVAVVDLSLGDAKGVELVRRLCRSHPELRVVVFSMHEERVFAEQAMRAGAMGYVMKSESASRVVEAVESALQGEIYLSREMASRLLGKLLREAGGGSRKERGLRFRLDELTGREREVFELLAGGEKLGEIAERLGVSRKTVETYRRRAKEKLGFATVGELMQYALQWGVGK